MTDTLSKSGPMDFVKSSPTVLHFISLNTEKPLPQMGCVRFCKHCDVLAGLLFMLGKKNAIRKVHIDNARPPEHTGMVYVWCGHRRAPSVQCFLTYQTLNRTAIISSTDSCFALLPFHGSVRDKTKNILGRSSLPTPRRRGWESSQVTQCCNKIRPFN